VLERELARLLVVENRWASVELVSSTLVRPQLHEAHPIFDSSYASLDFALLPHGGRPLRLAKTTPKPNTPKPVSPAAIRREELRRQINAIGDSKTTGSGKRPADVVLRRMAGIFALQETEEISRNFSGMFSTIAITPWQPGTFFARRRMAFASWPPSYEGIPESISQLIDIARMSLKLRR
jgi:hypothetical protein